jgi:hypothetical protein
LVKAYDAVKGAKEIVDARTPKWKRIGLRALRIAEALLLIVAGHYAKKLPITKLLK